MRLIYLFFTVLFFLTLTIPVFGATQTISVVEKQVADTGTGESLWSIVKGYWWVLVIILILLIGIVWFGWWLIGKIKEGDDVWYQIFKDKKHLAKIHRDKFRVSAFFSFSKNCAIRVYYTNSSKVHSKVVGHYRGHYLSHEGNMCVLFNCQRKWLIFPKPDIIFLNTKDTIRISRTEQQKIGNEMKVVKTEHDIKFPSNFFDFRPQEIAIFCYGLDKDYRTGFYFPVLKDKSNNVINMALPVYESVKQIAIEGYLYDQTDDFVRVAKKSIDLNPMIRGINKVADASSSIDTQQQSYRQGAP